MNVLILYFVGPHGKFQKKWGHGEILDPSKIELDQAKGIQSRPVPMSLDTRLRPSETIEKGRVTIFQTNRVKKAQVS